MAICPNTLKNIAYDCSSSKGGIVEAWLCGWQKDIFTLDASGESIESVSTAVTFNHYEFRRGTGSATSTLNVDEPNGVNYVATDLILQFNKQETAKRTGVAALALGGVAGIYKDGNGKYFAIGVEEPVMASAGSAQTGTASTDGNFYQITLHDEAASFPFEVAKSAAEGINVVSES